LRRVFFVTRFHGDPRIQGISGAHAPQPPSARGGAEWLLSMRGITQSL